MHYLTHGISQYSTANMRIHIYFKRKCNIFKSWIESGILFVNDIIQPTSGKIDELLILDEWNNKSNSISQINVIVIVISRI